METVSITYISMLDFCNVATGWEGCLANGGLPGPPSMAKTDKEQLATGFWDRIESNQATDCNIDQ